MPNGILEMKTGCPGIGGAMQEDRRMRLVIKIEQNGKLIPAGTIEGNDRHDACFRYAEDYCEHGGVPVSISLPLQKDAFSAEQTAAFFEGLLPEGFTRRSVAQWMHADENDYLSILHGLGKECLGAICVQEEGEEVTASYERVTESQIRELAAEGVVKSAQMVIKSHLSLTGASGKAGLYYDGNHDEWYLPHGTAPSTHIVKQSHVRLESIVVNERLSMMTAGKCGLSIPGSRILNTGHGKEQEVLFATRRYDRLVDEDSRMIGTLPCPYRLHQEDFCQAMGLPASEKYEGKTPRYLQGMFDILRKYSSDPVRDQLQLWDTILFDYLIGNTDAHIKNFSLLYDKNLKRIRLAPAYDMISTSVYEQSARDMAFHIGDARSLDDISKESFRIAARQAGLGEKMGLRRLEGMAARFPEALKEAAGELAEGGYGRAQELADRILQTGGWSRIHRLVLP
jgi:serine/threonine-protein kinase HipA